LLIYLINCATHAFVTSPGYQDEDMKYRLLQFAKESSRGRPSGFQQPSVYLHAGSFLPNSSDSKTDKSAAKIANCSEKEKQNNWGTMNTKNMNSMKSKLQSGQVCRNIQGRKDTARAIEERKAGRATATAFFTNVQIGSMVCIWKPTKADFSADDNLPTTGTAGPAQSTSPPASFSQTTATTPSKAAPAKPANLVPEPVRFASGLGRSLAPKAAPAPPTTTARVRPDVVPKARPQPRTQVVLHTYSVGLATLLEGL
jgi:hypothetical protein